MIVILFNGDDFILHIHMIFKFYVLTRPFIFIRLINDFEWKLLLLSGLIII